MTTFGHVPVLDALESIRQDDLVYQRGDQVIFESIIERDYPNIDVQLLCDVLSDRGFNWHQAVKDYVDCLHQRSKTLNSSTMESNG